MFTVLQEPTASAGSAVEHGLLHEVLEIWRPRIERELESAVEELSPGELLGGAMRHALLSGGKRVRPVLAVLAARAVDGDACPEPVMRAGCALEIVHCFTLVHDDLPAMDDAGTRRGEPTLHVMHDEATAVLAGDALFNLAFRQLGRAMEDAPEKASLGAVTDLVTRAVHEVVEGQVLDLELSGREVSEQQVERLHRLKTAALIRAAAGLGGMLAGADERRLELLDSFAEHLGLAYQARDDIISKTGDEEVAGKSLETDEDLDKPTLVRAAGLQRAREVAREHMQKAIAALDGLPGETGALRELAEFTVERER